MSALGIAIGIAAMVAVVGISSSSREELDRELAALGTNLLTVSPGTTMLGETAKLPAEVEAMIARIEPVTSISAVAVVSNAKVYRSDQIPKAQSNGLAVYAARVSLPPTVGVTMRSGTWLNGITSQYPAVVLGDTAPKRIGIGLVGCYWGSRSPPATPCTRPGRRSCRRGRRQADSPHKFARPAPAVHQPRRKTAALGQTGRAATVFGGCGWRSPTEEQGEAFAR